MMNRLGALALVVSSVSACTAMSPAAPPALTTKATLDITPDTSPLARSIHNAELSAFIAPYNDAWQVVLSSAPPGTPCTEAPLGPGALTFYLPTLPPLFPTADGSTAEPIDVAGPNTPLGPDPHAELDLAVATRETLGALYFKQDGDRFSGSFDATTTSDTGEMSVTGTFDTPICYGP